MGRIAGLAGLLTLCVVAITQAACFAVWGGMEGGYDPMIVVVGAVLPAATCFPISMVLLLQRQRLTAALLRLEEAHHLLQERASRDPMTALLHRQAFFEQLAATGGGAGAFLMIDVDHFKAINDRHGHAAGDEALRLIADALRDVASGAGLVARFGGEEFCVHATGADVTAGELLAELIRRRIGALPFAPGGRSRRLTVSIGVCDAAAYDDADAAIHAADEALYRAKERGRDRVVVARPPTSRGGEALREGVASSPQVA